MQRVESKSCFVLSYFAGLYLELRVILWRKKKVIVITLWEKGTIYPLFGGILKRGLHSVSVIVAVF